MKPFITKYVSTIFLIFAALRADVGRGEFVRDVNRKSLVPNAEYYILLANNDGVLMPGTRGLKLCPLDVVVAPEFIGKGRPVRFDPLDSEIAFIPESFNLNIEFSELLWTCPSSKVWKIDGLDAVTEQYFVTTGGEIGNPYEETSLFKIERFEDDYKLRFCPKEESRSNQDLCRDIGIYSEPGDFPGFPNRRLALSDTPLKVKFEMKRFFDVSEKIERKKAI